MLCIHRGKLPVWCWTWNRSGSCLTSSAQSAMATKTCSEYLSLPPRATITNQNLGIFYPSWTLQCSVSGGPHAVLVSAPQEGGSEVTEGAEKQNEKGWGMQQPLYEERLLKSLSSSIQVRKGQGGWIRWRLGKPWKHWLKWMLGSCWTSMQHLELHYSVFW